MTPQAYPRRTAQPAAEPVTLAEALVHLREVGDGGANDAYITTLITVARQACEERTERTLIATPWRLTLPSFANGSHGIALAQPPVITVQSVQYLDTAGDLQTVDPADYVVHTHLEPAILAPAPGFAWPAVQPGRLDAVRVNYTAGYGATAASVPAPLRQWILLAIGSLYDTRHADASQAVVTHGFVDALLAPYRMLGV
jgi:uncharacterized phiE125 gp8 family phage protein